MLLTISSLFGNTGASFMTAIGLCSMPVTDSSRLSDVGASFCAANRFPRPMPTADSSRHGHVGTTFMAASDLPPMPNADTSCYNLVGTSFFTAPWPLCPVPNAESSLFDIVGASLMAAFWYHRTMLDADSSFLDLIGASVMSAYRRWRPLCPMSITKPSLIGKFATSLMAAHFLRNNCTVPDAYSSSHGAVCASFRAARFADICPMSLTNPSFECIVGASVCATSFWYPLRSMPTAHPSLNDLICATFVAAGIMNLFPPMLETDPSFRGLVIASLMATPGEVEMDGNKATCLELEDAIKDSAIAKSSDECQSLQDAFSSTCSYSIPQNACDICPDNSVSVSAKAEWNGIEMDCSEIKRFISTREEAGGQVCQSAKNPAALTSAKFATGRLRRTLS